MKDEHIRKDLVSLFVLVAFIAVSFVALAEFDKKDEIFNKVGQNLFSFITRK